MISEEYKKAYEIPFIRDVKFSGKFLPTVKEIIDKVNIPTRLRDNLGTPLDLKGYDVTLKPIQIGLRVRRYEYLHYNEFTQDDKERIEMDCDYYFFGYANYESSHDERKNEFEAYLLFDNQDFKKERGRKIPLKSRQRNREGSLVYFSCYDVCDIEKQCKTYVKSGPIGCTETVIKKYQEKLEFFPYTNPRN